MSTQDGNEGTDVEARIVDDLHVKEDTYSEAAYKPREVPNVCPNIVNAEKSPDSIGLSMENAFKYRSP